MGKPNESFREVEMLKNLSQQAAAWSLGVTARTLRDHPEIPRTAEGGYDIRDLAKWAVQHGPRDAVAFDDELYERIVTLAEAMLRDLGPHLWQLVALLDNVEDDHGPDGVLSALSLMRDAWGEIPGPELEAMRDVPESIEDIIEMGREVLRRRQAEKAHDVLRVMTRCQECGAVRRGRRWVKEAKTPALWTDMLTLCPQCDRMAARKDKAVK
ncbi:MAG: hypothetical protein KA184_11805 [Candidatus Hydrogenedentes bacterium]|nr:hypothetical protein [Candidatus Hydrogenedentota bacterium]